MLPFHEQDYNITCLEQLELNNPHHSLPNSSYFPFQLDGYHDLLFAADGALTRAPRPSVPLVDSVPLQPQSATMRSATAAGLKRPTRKGRHSKICTAAGPRDRRMRLSIDVARSFFRLQDMLGFDKASKTVQWLLTVSKTAIKELAGGVSASSSKIRSSSGDRSPKSESSTLACEASSSTNKAAAGATRAAVAAAGKAKKTRAKKEAVKATKKTEFHSAQARELRAKARERARERTKEKQRNMTPNGINFDAVKDEASLHDLKSLLEFVNDAGHGMNPGTEEAYEYPMIGGPPPVLIPPVLGNAPPLPLPPATANNNTSGNIFEEQWEMEALSLYARSLQVAFSNYPN